MRKYSFFLLSCPYYPKWQMLASLLIYEYFYGEVDVNFADSLSLISFLSLLFHLELPEKYYIGQNFSRIWRRSAFLPTMFNYFRNPLQTKLLTHNMKFHYNNYLLFFMYNMRLVLNLGPKSRNLYTITPIC